MWRGRQRFTNNSAQGGLKRFHCNQSHLCNPPCKLIRKEKSDRKIERIGNKNRILGTRPYKVKWSRKTGQLAKVYPQPLKGYENGEAPELYRSV